MQFEEAANWVIIKNVGDKHYCSLFVLYYVTSSSWQVATSVGSKVRSQAYYI